MNAIVIKNAQVVNEGKITSSDVLIKNGRFAKIAPEISKLGYAHKEINAGGQHLIPGVIDNHVHFREPGLTHKGTIASESAAAVAGGITSYMEMPNTSPPAITIQALDEKFKIAQKSSHGNYSFYLGATNDNLDEIRNLDYRKVCGLKVFMGSSTGNMLVDDEKTLTRIFSECDTLVAVHCEDEPGIRKNEEEFKARYGDNIPFNAHPVIRNEEICYMSSEKAVGLAKMHGTRLHVLHLTTAEEIPLFSNKLALEQKIITTEVCVHYLFLDSSMYDERKGLVKCNPAVKDARHKEALLKALVQGNIDMVSSDHAPHLLSEKNNPYMKCPSGLPLVQHSLLMMLELYHDGKMSLPLIVDKMSHAQAVAYNIVERGYIREDYFADCALIDLKKKQVLSNSKSLSKAGWTPFDGYSVRSSVSKTFVNGSIAYQDGKVLPVKKGMQLEFSA